MDDPNDPLRGVDPPTTPLRPFRPPRPPTAGPARAAEPVSDADRMSLRRFGVPLRGRYRRFDANSPAPPEDSLYTRPESRSVPQWTGRADHYPVSWTPPRAEDGSYVKSAAETPPPRTPPPQTSSPLGTSDTGPPASSQTPRGRHRRQVAPQHGVASVLRDILLVTFGKYGQYAITVITLPLIARVLGPHGVGLLAIGMGAYFIGSLLVDLGITQFLAARVHEAEHNPDEVNRLRGTYFAIRATSVSLIGAALLLSLVIGVPPALHMALLGMFAGGFWSLSEDWLLIGQGRFGSSTMYQGAGRIGYLILLVVLLPRFPSASMAVLCLLISSVATVALTWWDSFRNFGPPARPHGLRIVLRTAAPVFTSRLLVTGYGQGSATIYGAILSAASLGLYSAGDRLVRAIQSTLDPIGFALLPRMARRSDHEHFWRNSFQALAAVVSIAVVAAIALWVSAPVLIHLVFGDDFAAAIPLLRVECLILPATTVTSYVTTAVLPVRQDTTGVLLGAIVGASVVAVALAVAMRTQSVWTLVYGTVFAEVSVALWYIIRMRWLILRERAVRRGAVAPANVLMRKGETAS